LSDLLDKHLREPIAFICSVFIASCFAFHGHSFIYAIMLQDVFHSEVQAEYYALVYAAIAQIAAVICAAQVCPPPDAGSLVPDAFLPAIPSPIARRVVVQAIRFSVLSSGG
jgi:hypothetical protein